MAGLRQALVDAVTPEEVRAIVHKLIEKAKSGNESAAKLLFQYVLGKPGPMPHPDRMDFEEWQTFLEHEPVAYGMNKASLSPHPSVFLDLARSAKPVVTEVVRKELVHGLTDPEGWRQKHDGERWKLVAERKKKGSAEPLTPDPSPRRGEGSRLGDVGSVSVCGTGGKDSKKKRCAPSGNGSDGGRRRFQIAN